MFSIENARSATRGSLLILLFAASTANAGGQADSVVRQMATSDGSPYFEASVPQSRFGSANSLAVNATDQTDSVVRQMMVSDGSPYFEPAQPRDRIVAEKNYSNAARDRWLEQQLSTSDGSSDSTYAVVPERQIGDDERLLIAGGDSANRGAEIESPIDQF